MSARNYVPAREKNLKFIDWLPNINHQKFCYRPIGGQELPNLSASTGGVINRNLNYSYEIQYPSDNDIDRSGTPFSDFFSDSEAGTPDFRSEESDSSAGSVLRRNTAEVTKILAEEWEKIERTLYDEVGEHTTRPQIIEECKQWKAIHPQLRVTGKALHIPEKKYNIRQVEHDEIIAMQYSDYDEFSEGAERLSQSSSDVTPQNSPRMSLSEEFFEPKLSREKITFNTTYDEDDIPDSFCSLLQITPMHIRSPLQRKRQNSSILKSEISASRWMRNRPDSSMNCDRNSAKSFMSLDTRNYANNMAFSASERNNGFNRILTARSRDLTKLDPIHTPEVHHNDMSKYVNGNIYQGNVRKVSLPPLLLEEEKKKIVSVHSAKKNNSLKKKSAQRNLFHLDKAKH